MPSSRSAGWSAKDHLMHVAVWEQALLAKLDGNDDLDGGNTVRVPAHSLGTGFIIHEDGKPAEEDPLGVSE